MEVLLKFQVFCVLIILSSCQRSSNSNNFTEKSYEDKVLSIKDEESLRPINFLNASGTYRENFLGDKFKIDCTITNSATAASFKDVVLRVTFYSKTKTVLGTEEITVYEKFPPNSRKTVKLKVNAYQNVSSIGWDVINAVAL